MITHQFNFVMPNDLHYLLCRFAYIEFVDKSSVENALKLDDTTFLGRQLKVLPKRQYSAGKGGKGGRKGGKGGRGGRYGKGGKGKF